MSKSDKADLPYPFDAASRAKRQARDRRLHDLGCTFPSLRSKLKKAEWLDLTTLENFAEGNAPTPSADHAARFILALWSRGEEKLTPFDAVTALIVWDEEHRAAFLAWAANPWWA